MSRPIYEPSLTRQDAALAYGSRQLFRRPAPSGMENLPWVRRKRGSSFDGGTSPSTTFTWGGDTALVYDDGGIEGHVSVVGSTDWQDYFEFTDSSTTKVLQDGIYLVKGNIHWDNIDQTKTFLVSLHEGNLWSEGWTITGASNWETPSHMWQTWKRMPELNTFFAKVQFTGSVDELASSWYIEVTRLGSFTGNMQAPDGILDE